MGEEEEGLALDPGLGQDLVPGIVKDLDPGPSLALDPVQELRKRRNPSPDRDPNPGPRSGLSLAQGPREEASPGLAQVKSPVPDRGLAPSRVTRKEILNHDPVLNQSPRRDQNLAPAQERGLSPVLDPTAPSLDLDPGLSLGATSAPPPGLTARKRRKLAVDLSPDPDQNPQQKMETSLLPLINRGLGLVPRLLRKWKRMVGTL